MSMSPSVFNMHFLSTYITLKSIAQKKIKIKIKITLKS